MVTLRPPTIIDIDCGRYFCCNYKIATIYTSVTVSNGQNRNGSPQHEASKVKKR